MIAFTRLLTPKNILTGHSLDKVFILKNLFESGQVTKFMEDILQCLRSQRKAHNILSYSPPELVWLLAFNACLMLTLQALASYPGHSQFFNVARRFSACNIEKLGVAWVRGYASTTPFNSLEEEGYDNIAIPALCRYPECGHDQSDHSVV